MDKIYRINYVVNEKGVSCSVYVYRVVGETKSYYLCKAGDRSRQISKNDIGLVKNVDRERIAYKVYVTDLFEKERYIDEMVSRVREVSAKLIERYKKIYDNANPCWCEIIEVEED